MLTAQLIKCSCRSDRIGAHGSLGLNNEGYNSLRPTPFRQFRIRECAFVMNYEEGSEPSIADGDGYSESGLTETPLSPVPTGSRDLAAESTTWASSANTNTVTTCP